MDSQLSDDEIKTLTSLLAKLEPGVLPPPVFYQFARLSVTPIIEIVPLHYQLGEIDVLLIPRDQNDPIWPGKLHVPRTVIRANDSATSPFERILSGELLDTPASKPIFSKSIIHHSGRGMEATQIYIVEIAGQANVGQFYNVKKLPGNLLESQMDFIPAAVETYLATRKPFYNY